MQHRAWASVAAGDRHSLAVKTDGTLWAWGHNALGQLGDGSTTDRSAPVQIGTDADWASVSAGSWHSLAMTTDGTLWAWGSISRAQVMRWLGFLEDRLLEVASTNWSFPVLTVKIGTGFASMAAACLHSFAVKTDGTLWAWGSNAHGGLGDGTTTDRSTPVQIGTDADWASVGASGSHALAVKTDGTLWAWGSNHAGQLGDGRAVRLRGRRPEPPSRGDGSSRHEDPPTTDRYAPVQIGTGFALVAAGSYHSLGLKTDGTLWAWGWNYFGQLGDGTTTDRCAPVLIGTGFASVAAGSQHSLAVKTDGTLWAWGLNGRGQLGDGTSTGRHTAVQIGTGFASVGSSHDSSHSLAVKTDGTLWAWGSNRDGQLGLGIPRDHVERPTQIRG